MRARIADSMEFTVGIEIAVRIPSKSLHRMLSPKGNPSTANFFALLRALQEKVGVTLKVRAA